MVIVPSVQRSTAGGLNSLRGWMGFLMALGAWLSTIVYYILLQVGARAHWLCIQNQAKRLAVHAALCLFVFDAWLSTIIHYILLRAGSAACLGVVQNGRRVPGACDARGAPRWQARPATHAAAAHPRRGSPATPARPAAAPPAGHAPLWVLAAHAAALHERRLGAAVHRALPAHRRHRLGRQLCGLGRARLAEPGGPVDGVLPRLWHVHAGERRVWGKHSVWGCCVSRGAVPARRRLPGLQCLHACADRGRACGQLP